MDNTDPRKKQIIREQLLKSALESGDKGRLHELLDKEPQLKRVASEMLWHVVLNDQPEMASMLLEAGADPNVSQENSPAKFQSTILHELVKKNYELVALLAMRREANVHARDADNLTALDHAVRKKSSLCVIRELVRRGAHQGSPSYGRPGVEASELVAELVGEFVDAETLEHQVDAALCHCLLHTYDESRVLPIVKTLLDMKKEIGRVELNLYIVLRAMQTRKVVMAQLLLEHGYHAHGLIHGWSKEVIELGWPVETRDRMVIKYLTIVIFKGKPINDFDMEIILSHPGMHAYHRQCLDELKKMKKMKIASNVSFYSVLVNVWEMPFFTRNPNVVENYEAVQRENEFPIYWLEMALALQSATMRKRSLSEREKAIFESLENILPLPECDDHSANQYNSINSEYRKIQFVRSKLS